MKRIALSQQIFLVMLAIAMIVAIAVTITWLQHPTTRTESGTYLILSRTLRIREANGQGIEACRTAAYRWRLGSGDAPTYLDSVETPDDCVGGYGVEENRLYKQIGPKKTVLDLNGKTIGDFPNTDYRIAHWSVTPDVQIELDTSNAPQSSLLRISDGKGALLREKDIGADTVEGVSPDGSIMYLGLSEVPDGFMGPWKLAAYDWKKDRMTEIKEPQNSTSYDERRFNREGTKLLYVINTHTRDPQGHGFITTTPSFLHMLDLQSGKDTLLRQAEEGEPFSHPRFSPDDTHYMVETPGADRIYDFTQNGAVLDTVVPKIADWFGNTIILNEFELIVHDTQTKKNVTVSKENASFDYVGRITVP